MESKERIKRPQLARTEPLRDWSTLLTGSTRTEDGPATAGPTPTSPDGSLSDVVSRSVDLGYRVIDEYVRQGQKAAQRLSDRSYGPDAMAGDAQELATRMAQYASDFTAVWFEFLQLAAGGVSRRSAPPSNPVAAAPPPTARDAPADIASKPAAADSTEPTRVKVAVTSPYPTEVSLDLKPHTTGRRLVLQSLRAVDPDKPRLSDVAIEDVGPDESLTLRIRVPAGQPAGVYNGLIVDEQTSRPVGTVSLRIAPE